MSRDEKRSDDGLSAERLEGIVRAHRRIRGDDIGMPWCVCCGTDWPCNTSRLVAALAAAREDAERWQKACMGEASERDQFAADLRAARVEVTQLQARIEALVAAWADLLRTESELMTTAQRNAWKDALAELRHVVLAEPLGSTEDPPAECPDCAASGFATTRDGRSLGVCDGCGGSGAAR